VAGDDLFKPGLFPDVASLRIVVGLTSNSHITVAASSRILELGATVMEEWPTVREPSRPATSERDVLLRRLVRLARHPLAGGNNAISVRSVRHMTL
jgi:hypothetical protein